MARWRTGIRKSDVNEAGNVSGGAWPNEEPGICAPGAGKFRLRPVSACASLAARSAVPPGAPATPGSAPPEGSEGTPSEHGNTGGSTAAGLSRIAWPVVSAPGVESNRRRRKEASAAHAVKSAVRPTAPDTRGPRPGAPSTANPDLGILNRLLSVVRSRTDKIIEVSRAARP